MVARRNGKMLRLVLGCGGVLVLYLLFYAKNPSVGGQNTAQEAACVGYFDDLYERAANWRLREQMDTTDTYRNPLIANYAHTFNIYNHCFLEGNGFAKLARMRPDVDTRMFPWLTGKLPIFMKADGTVSGVPGETKVTKMAKTAEQLRYSMDQVPLHVGPSNVPFWTNYNRYVRGRGIVVTLGDKYATLGVKLVRNLRMLGTLLPVQIVHHNELSAEVALMLIEEATRDFVVEDRELFEELREIQHPEFDASFPKLKIEFINTKPAIRSHSLFERYNRKFLAVLFTTFAEYILLDVDAVLFTKPENFFSSSQYQATGTLFFKDRNLVSARVEYFNELVQDLFPTEKEAMVFGVPTLPTDIMSKEYLKYNHVDYMESGVVCMDKSRFMPGLLMSVFLSMRRPIVEATTGDKELFWLGQLVAGESRFAFNDHWAAASGRLSAGREGLNSRELCSTHPAHVSSDTNRLMWLNTGGINCRDYDISDVAKDLTLMTQRYPEIQSEKDLAEYYESPVSFENILFPPPNTDLLELPQNLRGEPRYGFLVSGCCRGYMWCGYDSVGDGSTPQQRGLLLDVDPKDERFYSYMVQVGKYLSQKKPPFETQKSPP